MGLKSLKHLIHLAVFLLVPLMTLTFSDRADAVQVDGLYNAVVPVASQQIKDRGDAFANALDIVLNKVSGDRSLHSESGLESILSRPQQFVSSFSYRDNPEFIAQQRAFAVGAGPGDNEDALDESGLNSEIDSEGVEGIAEEARYIAPYLIDVVFSSSAVNAGMRSYGVPIWGKTRPSLLLWVAHFDGAERRLLGTSDESDIAPALSAASIQGLPAFFPVVDLEDMSAIDVNDVWGLYPGSVEVGARRYAPDVNVLVRNNTQLGNGELGRFVELDWVMSFKGLEYTGAVKGEDEAQAWSQVMIEVSQVLASRYAVRQTSDEVQGLMTIEVSGVESFSDYAGLEKYLSSLPTIKSSRLLWVRESSAAYMLDLKGQRAQFFEYVDLGNKMKRKKVVSTIGSLEIVETLGVSEVGRGDSSVELPTKPVNTEYFVWNHPTALKD